jgi:hypothetical protein
VASQSGEFLAAKQWYPFTANLLAVPSYRSPGFVWEARVDILRLPNRVLESYVNGRGNIMTKAWGKLPLIQVEEEEPYILFWLAMVCPLYPFALLEGGGREGGGCFLTWKSTTHDLSVAKAELVVDGEEEPFAVEFFFREEDGLLERIRVNAPHMKQPWQALYKEYKELSSVSSSCQGNNNNNNNNNNSTLLLVPSTIEVGKGHGEDFRLHMKIHNHDVEYR